MRVVFLLGGGGVSAMGKTRISMPKRWEIPSLEKLALEALVWATPLTWIRDFKEGDLAFFHIQDLILLLGRNKDFIPPMLHLLLLSQLRDLNLTTCRNMVTSSVALTIRVRCRNLSSLNLHGCKQIPADALVRLVESLPHLITLDLSKTHCNRQVLSAIGATCHKLRGLNLSLCKRLSLKSLMYLAYDPLRGSFGCQELRELRVWGLEVSRGHCLALIFVLLALPRLTYLVDNSIVKAVCLIRQQQFGSSRMPPGFPSLTELVQRRINNNTEEGVSRLTLALREMTILREFPLPLINVVCPYLTKMTLFLGDRTAFTNTSLSWSYLTHLTIICDKGRDLGELLPMAANLGAQLRSLTIRYFYFTDEFSFHDLLRHCIHLQEFEGSFLPPKKQFHGLQLDIDTLDWDLSLPRLEFPQLSLFVLEYSDGGRPLPYRHAMVLRQSLVNLLKHSPCLKVLTLRCLPFSLDRVFQRVLNPPGTALRNIDELTLFQIKISMDVINLILSSENELSYLCLLKCPGICSAEYSALLEKVDREGFDMIIQWKCPS